MRKIILASTSPRRKELLEKAGLIFDVIPSNYEEDMTLDLIPEELAKFLSKGKAIDVAKNFNDAIIISADTFVSLDDKIIGKPHTEEKAKITLKTLSGKTHSVFTGFTIIDTKKDKIVSKVVETKVSFKELSNEMIDDYIKKGNPLKYAGSYTLNDIADKFIEKIVGDPLNIIGFPVDTIMETLKEFGIKKL
ncbi:septum formation protein Maf [Candidatus Nomurabacteria bacterium RIFOXYC2_FULL_36_19]|uniref:Nucleoside triphosphate pyrophosphatase n=1 Tax=Candidatus Nomurabacteria bacterium RIFOXYC2_FULL_36_19 TaxID=1801806 RepID=A0A1F6YSC8_9BACT|nr:MAG: septum formation protein Maf [Candidatus Nomurabacteria bacterium RIFOXYA2_FULL_35_9]OGJ09265.1 MAG: septum formation protein Maf [Candidatus Nomurabacteria bacterium RIFOXYC2_FULL_36_19]